MMARESNNNLGFLRSRVTFHLFMYLKLIYGVSYGQGSVCLILTFEHCKKPRKNRAENDQFPITGPH